jgi:hypothetical protein
MRRMKLNALGVNGEWHKLEPNLANFLFKLLKNLDPQSPS